MGFKIYYPNVPTNEERIADTLAEIKEALAEIKRGLTRIDDPRVWSGYPEDLSNGDEDYEDDRRVGLFLNLERCTRGSPTWQMAMAIRTAFELGRASIAGKASKAAYTKLIADTEALAVGRSKAAKITAAKKTAWHTSAKLIYEEQRKASPDASAESIATIIVEKLGPIRAIKTIANKIYEWDAERLSLPVG